MFLSFLCLTFCIFFFFKINYCLSFEAITRLLGSSCITGVDTNFCTLYTLYLWQIFIVKDSYMHVYLYNLCMHWMLSISEMNDPKALSLTLFFFFCYVTSKMTPELGKGYLNMLFLLSASQAMMLLYNSLKCFSVLFV